MSKTPTPRKRSTKTPIDADAFAGIGFASKEKKPQAPLGATPREPIKEEQSGGRTRGAATSIFLPPYVQDQMESWLDKHPDHTQNTMILIGLQSLGIDVRDDDLVPKRKRRRRAVSE